MAFRALVAEEGEAGPRVALRTLPAESLPEGDVLVAVAYSGLNYKDALAVTGRGRVIRRYPLIPGIDLAGTVVESSSPLWRAGDPVVLTGWDLGVTHHGGYAELARVPAAWPVRLPDGMDLRQAMGLGTAGLTAMLAVMELERHGVGPAGGPVLVTGAGGGVGGFAVALLAALGYEVVAATGRAELRPYLTGLGAREVVGREALEPQGGPLGSERWAGAVDAVGGNLLAGALRSVARGGCVAACGNAGGVHLTTTVFPFILRGVALVGVDSVRCPAERRTAAWSRLAEGLPAGVVERIAGRLARLEDVPALSEEVLAGRVRGRIVVDVREAAPRG